ncbi:hypothetical protein GCM10008023_40110 [Sphingomonas glacialis]|uniref:Uncharacterized protein n=1 Tax=Sphingomonas glacialis TaxID=658225 RepID=A0ABQ3LUB9_9SPHN|nr:hypothetical protein GCM10008023_40110 [Sphingomonas glacialis]
MLFLLASLVSISAPFTYHQARELAFQTPYALDAKRRGADVAARKGDWDHDGWTFRLFARNCTSPSCLVGWVHVNRATGAITDPVAEKPISSQHLTLIEANLRR